MESEKRKNMRRMRQLRMRKRFALSQYYTDSYVRELRRVTAVLGLQEQAIASASEGITITDMRLPDSPLVYVNEGFVRMTGYSRQEVLHRNCRLLQGVATDPENVHAIRDALREGRSYVGELLNYRKDGTPFWNRLSLTPLRDANGKLTHYVGVQSNITERVQAEMELRKTLELLRVAHDRLASANEEMHRNLRAAADMQKALLPSSTPSSEVMRVAWRFEPCDELGGDILNVFRLGDRHIGMYLLDVTGHGVAAALLAVSVGHLLSPNADSASVLWTPGPKGQQWRITPPAEVANRLNQRFPWDMNTRQFFTMVYGVLDIQSLELCYVSAGHPLPLVLPNRPGRSVAKGTGLPIGLETNPYQEYRIQLYPKDRIVLYSDGVTEVAHPKQGAFGVERLEAYFSARRSLTLEDNLVYLLAVLKQWHGRKSRRDDISLLALEIL